MYCSSCGKQNPEGAAFCAFCGKKMTAPQEESQTFIEGELLVPDKESHQAPPASHQPYMRPDPSRLVTPMADNPAQPARRSEMRKARLNIYQDCNDAFRKLLLGKFGRRREELLQKLLKLKR